MKSLLYRTSLLIATTIQVFCCDITPLAAQGPTAQYVLVVLEGCGEEFPSEVRVTTYNNPSMGSFPAERVRRTNTLRGEPGQPFNTDGIVASASFDGGRTDCGQSIHVPAERGSDEKEDSYEYMARFRFTCDRTDIWRSLMIDNVAGAQVTAVRDYRSHVPCREGPLSVDAVKGLKSVAWNKELVYVHFGDTSKVHGYPYYDLLIRKGAVEGKPIEGEAVIKRDRILGQLTVRAGRGSGNAVTIRNEFNLDKRIKSVQLKVK